MFCFITFRFVLLSFGSYFVLQESSPQILLYGRIFTHSSRIWMASVSVLLPCALPKVLRYSWFIFCFWAWVKKLKLKKGLMGFAFWIALGYFLFIWGLLDIRAGCGWWLTLNTCSITRFVWMCGTFQLCTVTLLRNPVDVASFGYYLGIFKEYKDTVEEYKLGQVLAVGIIKSNVGDSDCRRCSRQCESLSSSEIGSRSTSVVCCSYPVQ